MSESVGSASQTLTSLGEVVAVEGQDCWVKTQRQSACGGCQSESGCGTSALSKLFSNVGSAPLKIPNQQGAQVGDIVELKLDESRLVQHAFMAYGLPLLGLFVGAFVLKSFAATLLSLSTAQLEGLSILGGLLGVLAGWAWTRHAYKPQLPSISRVVSQSA